MATERSTANCRSLAGELEASSCVTWTHLGALCLGLAVTTSLSQYWPTWSPTYVDLCVVPGGYFV